MACGAWGTVGRRCCPIVNPFGVHEFGKRQRAQGALCPTAPARARIVYAVNSAAPHVTAPLTAEQLALAAARAASDLKATDLVVLDLRGVTDVTDFFVIASGTSDTHVRSVAEHVAAELKKHGAPVHHAEGLQQGRWALLDFVDCVVHVFHPTLRQFYQLERLWGDAAPVALGFDPREGSSR
jgi:ribosome-associated protein